jgi:hypothetical protein
MFIYGDSWGVIVLFYFGVPSSCFIGVLEWFWTGFVNALGIQL